MIRGGKNMVANISSLMSIYKDPEHRLILYYLANKNPRIDEQTLSKATGIPLNRTREILSNIQGEHLVFFETKKGYTLTEKGLAGLYNFHSTINK